MSAPNLSPKEAEWRRIKGQIIARYGTLLACAKALGCSPQSLRLCVLSDLLPGIRKNLDRALQPAPEKLAA